MKKILFCVTFLMSTYSLIACEVVLQDLNLCVDVKWIQGPKYGIFCKAQVSYYKKDDEKKVALEPPFEIEVYPWMIMEGGMEHGARDTVAKKIKDGIYEVNFIQFMKMAGRWELRFKKKGDHSKNQSLAAIKVELP